MVAQRISLLNVPVDAGISADGIFDMLRSGEPALITMIGPEAWKHVRKNPSYRDQLERMTLVLPTSRTVALTCFLASGAGCDPFSFDMTCFAHDFFTLLANEKIPMSIVGGGPSHDEEVKDVLCHKFPGLDVVSTAHGFSDFVPKIAAVIKAKPKVVLVSIVGPLQEEFMLALRDAGYQGFVIGCGDFIDVPLVMVHDYALSATIEQYHLLPFYRAYKEPERITKRAITGYLSFGYLVISYAVKRFIAFCDTMTGKAPAN